MSFHAGLVWELAPEFGALVVFAEHRYYGETMPFGNDTYTNNSNLAWLSSEQALADFAVLIESLRQNMTGAASSPVIAFGGSYGGMLTAWARMKYPGTFAGGIAASAPILQFEGLVQPQTYMQIITRDFAEAGPYAAQGIAASWGIMKAMAQTAGGRAQLSAAFSTCEPISTAADVVDGLWVWISNALGFMAMADYPYPAAFLGPMPASPINASAAFFTAPPSNMGDAGVLSAVRSTMNLFYNHTGQEAHCFNTKQLNPPGLRVPGWNYQSCTEMVMPIGQYGEPSDMFYPAPWSLQGAVQGCQSSYGVTPRPQYVPVHYGGKHLGQFTNIVFTNGNLDPWYAGGVTFNSTEAVDNGVVAVVIQGGAHHLDLRFSNPADPQSVIDARNIQRMHIRKWIKNWE